jgi:hypothetical protein
MTWTDFVSTLAIASRRRAIATALVYGLSLTVRFTSGAGEETEIPPQAVQRSNLMTSIMINDGGQLFYKDWPIAFQRGWSLGSRGCGAACENPMTMRSCSSPP